MKTPIRFALALTLAAAATPLAPALAQTNATQDTRCSVLEVAVFTDRVHVRCSLSATLTQNGGQGVAPYGYYAMATNTPAAAAFVEVATAARAADKPLLISYRDSPSQNPAGCQANDCRGVASARIAY